MDAKVQAKLDDTKGPQHLFLPHSTLARRKRNHIALVKDERGEWLTEESEVIEHFRKGFTALYTTF